MPDIRTPHPDAGYETLRQAVVQAIDDLSAQVQRINDTFLLLLTTADFAQSTLSTAIGGQAAIANLGQQVAMLNQRITVIEAALPDTPS